MKYDEITALDLIIEVKGTVNDVSDDRLVRFYAAPASDAVEGFMYFLNELGQPITFLHMGKHEFIYDVAKNRVYYESRAEDILLAARAKGYTGLRFYASYRPEPIVEILEPENYGVVYNLDLTHPDPSVGQVREVNTLGANAYPTKDDVIFRGETEALYTGNITHVLREMPVVAIKKDNRVISNGIFIYSKWMETEQKTYNVLRERGFAIRFEGDRQKKYSCVFRLGLPSYQSQPSKVSITPIFGIVNKLENLVTFSKGTDPKRKLRTKYVGEVDLGNDLADQVAVKLYLRDKITDVVKRNEAIGLINDYGVTDLALDRLKEGSVYFDEPTGKVIHEGPYITAEMEKHIRDMMDASNDEDVEKTDYYFVDHRVDGIVVNDEGYGIVQLNTLMTSTTMTNMVLSGVVIAEEVNVHKPFLKDANSSEIVLEPIAREFVLPSNIYTPTGSGSYLTHMTYNSCNRFLDYLFNEDIVKAHNFSNPVLVIEYETDMENPEELGSNIWVPIAIKTVRVGANDAGRIHIDDILRYDDVRMFLSTKTKVESIKLRTFMVDAKGTMPTFDRLYTNRNITVGSGAFSKQVNLKSRYFIDYPIYSHYWEYEVAITPNVWTTNITASADENRIIVTARLILENRMGFYNRVKFKKPIDVPYILAKKIQLDYYDATREETSRKNIQEFTVEQLIKSPLDSTVIRRTNDLSIERGVGIYEIELYIPRDKVELDQFIINFGSERTLNDKTGRCIVKPTDMLVDDSDEREVEVTLTTACQDAYTNRVFVNGLSSNPDLMYMVKNKMGIMVDYGEIPRESDDSYNWTYFSDIAKHGIITLIIYSKKNPIKKFTRVIVPDCHRLSDVSIDLNVDCVIIDPTLDKVEHISFETDSKQATTRLKAKIVLNPTNTVVYDDYFDIWPVDNGQYIPKKIVPIDSNTSLTYTFWSDMDTAVMKTFTLPIDCLDKRKPEFVIKRDCSTRGESVMTFTMGINSSDFNMSLVGEHAVTGNFDPLVTDDPVYCRIDRAPDTMNLDSNGDPVLDADGNPTYTNGRKSQVVYRIPAGYDKVTWKAVSINNPAIYVSDVSELACSNNNPISENIMLIPLGINRGKLMISRNSSSPAFTFELKDQTGAILAQGLVDETVNNLVEVPLTEKTTNAIVEMVSYENGSITKTTSVAVNLLDSRPIDATVSSTAAIGSVNSATITVTRLSTSAPVKVTVFDDMGDLVTEFRLDDNDTGVEKLTHSLTVDTARSTGVWRAEIRSLTTDYAPVTTKTFTVNTSHIGTPSYATCKLFTIPGYGSKVAVKFNYVGTPNMLLNLNIFDNMGNPVIAERTNVGTVLDGFGKEIEQIIDLGGYYNDNDLKMRLTKVYGGDSVTFKVPKLS